MSTLQQQLRRLRACEEAVFWVGERDLETAWRECQRGDWMLWLAGRVAGDPLSDSRRPLTLAACECARLALRYVPEGEMRPLAAIELAERWARGDASVTRGQLRDAAAAYAVTVAADVVYAADAAYAADYAAAYAAAYAAVAAYAAAVAVAADAAYAASRTETLARCADIMRKHYPTPPVLPS